VAYISPELVSGHNADARSDLYAIGIMLFELLTGEQPFRGQTSMSIAFQHVNDTVPPPSSVVPGLPQDLDELVEWCTSKDPDDRPVDAAALLGELRHVKASLTAAQLDVGDREIAARQRNYDDAATAIPVALDRDVEEKYAGYIDESEPASSYSEAGDTDEADQGVTTVIPTNDNATEVFTRVDEPEISGQQRTEIIDARSESAHDTGVISAVNSGGPTPRPPSPAAAAKQARKDAKVAQREWKREAQKPLVKLDKKGSGVRRWILAIVLIMLAALLAATGWFFGLGPGALVSLPQVSGKTVAEATQVLDDAGVAARPKEVFSDSVERGLVVDTDPSANSTIRRFQGAELLVSKGPELFEVPNLSQLARQDAEGELENHSLQLGTVKEVFSESVLKGNVVSQTPQPGSQQRRDTRVNLTVSKGPAPVTVPDLTGMTLTEATAALENIGLKLNEGDQEYSSSVPAGELAGQSVKAGQKVSRGTEVTVSVSRGPRMVEVPRVVGEQLDEARTILEDLGFEVEVRYPLGNLFGTVHGQSVFGESVPEGSTIVLTVV
jgi:serine/threonine-protein kinase